jgi:hypothetical protein
VRLPAAPIATAAQPLDVKGGGGGGACCTHAAHPPRPPSCRFPGRGATTKRPTGGRAGRPGPVGQPATQSPLPTRHRSRRARRGAGGTRGPQPRAGRAGRLPQTCWQPILCTPAKCNVAALQPYADAMPGSGWASYHTHHVNGPLASNIARSNAGSRRHQHTSSVQMAVQRRVLQRCVSALICTVHISPSSQQSAYRGGVAVHRSVDERRGPVPVFVLHTCARRQQRSNRSSVAKTCSPLQRRPTAEQRVGIRARCDGPLDLSHVATSGSLTQITVRSTRHRAAACARHAMPCHAGSVSALCERATAHRNPAHDTRHT